MLGEPREFFVLVGEDWAFKLRRSGLHGQLSMELAKDLLKDSGALHGDVYDPADGGGLSCFWLAFRDRGGL